MPPNKGHNTRDIEDTKMEMQKPISNSRFSFDALSPRNPCKYPQKPYIPRNKTFRLTFLTADSMGLSLLIFKQLLLKLQCPKPDVWHENRI